MRDPYARTIIHTPIPNADMTPLEALVLSRIFESETAPWTREPATRFFASERPRDVITAQRGDIARALADSLAFESRLNAYIGAAVAADGPPGLVAIDMSGLDFGLILQDVVRRSATLTFVTVVALVAASAWRAGHGGVASRLIAVLEIRRASTTECVAEQSGRAEACVAPRHPPRPIGAFSGRAECR